jgi:N-acylneuraminate cytidylyltransferase
MKIDVTPARGGSKRIPPKNIKDFNGKPMIAWSIEAAIASGCFDNVIASTDDEIRDVELRFGAEVPLVRSAELANDHAGTTEVISRAKQWVLDKGYDVQSVCCIYAAAPFIQFYDLRRGCEMLNSGDWDFAFIVTEFSAPLFRSFKQLPEGGVEMFFPVNFHTRSQNLPLAADH